MHKRLRTWGKRHTLKRIYPSNVPCNNRTCHSLGHFQLQFGDCKWRTGVILNGGGAPNPCGKPISRFWRYHMRVKAYQNLQIRFLFSTLLSVAKIMLCITDPFWREPRMNAEKSGEYATQMTSETEKISMSWHFLRIVARGSTHVNLFVSVIE